MLELIPDASGNTYTATYNGSRNVTIHAQFAELPIGPYLSVVAADEETQQQLDKKGIESEHGHVTGNRPDTPVSELYGGEKYGNTISTGSVSYTHLPSVSEYDQTQEAFLFC